MDAAVGTGRRGAGRPGDRRRAAQLMLRPRVWLCWALLCALPALVAVAAVGVRHRAAAGAGRRVPVGRGDQRRSCSRRPRSRWCCRCSCRSPSRSSPATRWPARRPPARCATCWSARSGGCGCWSAKLVSRGGVRAARGAAGDGHLATSSGWRCSASAPTRRSGSRAAITSLSGAVARPRRELAVRIGADASATSRCACSRFGAIGLFFSTLTDSPTGRRARRAGGAS